MITVYDSSAIINFKSNKDAKVSTVRLRWKPSENADYVVVEKSFNNTSQVKITAGEIWQEYEIPLRTEILISIQSRNGINVAEFSREGSFYLDPSEDPSDDYEIQDGFIEIVQHEHSFEIIFTEFEEV